MISFILTTRNTLPYTKLAYESIRKYNPTIEIVMLDDASSDGTIEWMKSLDDQNLITWYNIEGKQLGHTITYNIGAELATKDTICIFHSDMVCSPNFVSNIEKHLKPKTIVSGTRIEPPVYPSDAAKHTQNFGIYIEEFKEKDFLEFVKQTESKNSNKTTNGFFAPWAMSRNEYLSIGGMDRLFKPFPIEDSDFINRLYLDGYKIIQSRDSLCYHWASRAHRWTTGRVQVDTDEFTRFQRRAMGNFLRKWGSYPKNDDFSYPIVSKKYDIGFVITCDTNQMIEHLLPTLELLCSTIYTDLPKAITDSYIKTNQKDSHFDLRKRVKHKSEPHKNDIIVKFNWSDFLGADFSVKNRDVTLRQMTQSFEENIKFLTILPDVISDSGIIGSMKHEIFEIEIKKLKAYEHYLLHTNDEYYQNQLIPIENQEY